MLKMLERRIDRFWSCHIDPGIFKQFLGILGTAAFQKREVVAQLLLASIENPLAQGDRRG